MRRLWAEWFLLSASLATAWPLKDCSAIVPPLHESSGSPALQGTPAAESNMASIVQHKSLHQKSRFWGQREPWFVSNIPNNSVVADLGCGAMHLRSALESSFHTGVQYIPVDAVHRGDAAMRLCNLNKHEYPLNLHPTPTVIVVQGVFEYIYDKLLFLRVLRCSYPRAVLLLSYAIGHRVGAFKAQGWVAPLLPEQLSEIFNVLQLNVTSRLPNCFPDQACLRLVSATLRPPSDVCAGSARSRQQLMSSSLKEERDAAASASSSNQTMAFRPAGRMGSRRGDAEREGGAGSPHKRMAAGGAGPRPGVGAGHGLGAHYSA